MSRKVARSWAMKALYEMEIKDSVDPLFPDEFMAYHEMQDDEEQFVTNILRKYIVQKDKIDGIIEEYIEDWDFERLNRLDLSILRLALLEITNGITPVSVVINEAVELSKKYSTAISYRFINGVLAAVVKGSSKDATN
ncbi:MAG: transcription antitermination factor NusB [Tissierellia bacterium]|nr:transcription antitermination factor NusB [Tissierellia bacterium]